jgi:hypothetical protein
MRRAVPIIACSLGSAAYAQTTIDPFSKYCWQENSGWMNWRDANNGEQGARDNMTYLSGFVWSESLGWINLGNHPQTGLHYSNAGGEDFGVNIRTDGTLGGFAWSENSGWINVDGGAMATPARPARIDAAQQRLFGFAWGENIGWVNLDLSVEEQFVQRLCYANCDGSTTSPVLTPNDFLCFLNQFSRAEAAANCDRSTGSPFLGPNDFLCFLNAYSNGCH